MGIANKESPGLVNKELAVTCLLPMWSPNLLISGQHMGLELAREDRQRRRQTERETERKSGSQRREREHRNRGGRSRRERERETAQTPQPREERE